ncbi:MAG: MBL fold metallo-hydrolase [Oscillospiraceae bacterium]|nr:MBL fold metallo-hydrolase [Oscillospiraceae bacterium]
MNLDNVNLINCDNTNCYIIRGTDGDILVDTGIPKYRDEIETWLLNYNVKLIVLTHGHNDHIGNAAYFSKLYDVPIAMSNDDMKLADDNLCRKFYSVGAAGKAVAVFSKKTMAKKVETFAVSIFLEDGMELGKEFGADCKAVKLDGHTKGSFGFLNGTDLYLGDAAMNYIAPAFPAICESPKAARASLNKIKTLKTERIFFSHGSPIETKSAAYRRMFI